MDQVGGGDSLGTAKIAVATQGITVGNELALQMIINKLIRYSTPDMRAYQVHSPVLCSMASTDIGDMVIETRPDQE